MANAGTFAKGVKRPNQGKHGPPKATLLAREAIAKLVDGNTHRLEGWLDEIAADERHGPAVAFKLMMDVMEYHVPKLSRAEHIGPGENGEHLFRLVERKIIDPVDK